MCINSNIEHNGWSIRQTRINLFHSFVFSSFFHPIYQVLEYFVLGRASSKVPVGWLTWAHHFVPDGMFGPVDCSWEKLFEFWLSSPERLFEERSQNGWCLFIFLKFQPINNFKFQGVLKTNFNAIRSDLLRLVIETQGKSPVAHKESLVGHLFRQLHGYVSARIDMMNLWVYESRTLVAWP